MKKLPKTQKNRGMTYIELIVVLSIFSIMSSIVLFNYGEFQARVDIRNLASNIALKVVEAQKASLAGKLPPTAQYSALLSPSTWKPSFGVYFNTASDANKKSFIYFTDLDNTTPSQNGIFDDFGPSCVGECLDQITITKGNYISKLEIVPLGTSCSGVVTGTTTVVNDLGILFRRPDSGATISTSNAVLSPSTFTCAQITISSSSSNTSSSIIKLFPSGRIQIN